MLSITQLLNFRRPVIYHLDYLDVVVDDKKLLLISWKFRHCYTLSIPALKRRYVQKESAVVVKLTASTDKLVLCVSTFWRKRKYRIALQRVQLDEATSQLIIRHFKPLKMPVVAVPVIKTTSTPHTKNIPAPILKGTQVKPRLIQIKTITEKLSFPT